MLLADGAHYRQPRTRTADCGVRGASSISCARTGLVARRRAHKHGAGERMDRRRSRSKTASRFSALATDDLRFRKPRPCCSCDPHVTAFDVGRKFPDLLADLGGPARVNAGPTRGEPFPADVESALAACQLRGAAERERRSHRLRARRARLDAARDGGRCAPCSESASAARWWARTLGATGGARPGRDLRVSATTRSSRWTGRPQELALDGNAHVAHRPTARRSRSPPGARQARAARRVSRTQAFSVQGATTWACS